MNDEVYLEFDDVLIVPQPSSISSRDDVDISASLSDTLKLEFPLIASPMVGVVNAEFASILSARGGLAILHRFYKSRKQLFEDIEEHIHHDDKFGISVRLGEPDFEEYFKYSPNIILVDTANGYNNRLLHYCQKIKDYISKHNIATLLMAGNVATYTGCKNLHNAGCDIIRIGIGGGSPCSTRNQTGIGVPTISSLMDCATLRLELGHDSPILIADGGIKNSGDFVKAIGAGADLAMAGRLFAECYEAPNKGVLYGMASRTHMNNSKIEIKSVEGIDTHFEKKHSLDQFMSEFGYGIKSAGTYINASNLFEVYLNTNFIRVTNSAIKKI